MTRFTEFVDAFWDPDIASTRGTDIIVKRMKDGKKLCKELEDYLKERCKAEQQYAKTLSQIAKRFEGREEVGELGNCFKQLKVQTEEIASSHSQAGNNFSALAKETASFNEDQNKTKAMKEDSLKKHQQNKLQHYQKSATLREKYFNKCREKDTAESAANAAHKSVSMKTNEIAKIDRNKEKAKESMEQADLAYKSSVTSLENARQLWEAEMEKTCKEFQTIEEERVDFTRTQLWKITNIDSLCCVQQDECAERVRQSLENCDIKSEIICFISLHTLGNQRPGAVVYESYYQKANQPPLYDRQNQQPLQDRRRAPQQLPAMKPPLPQEPRPHPQTSPKHVTGQPPRLQSPKQPTQLITFDEDDGAYSSITPTVQASTSAELPLEVKKPYTAKSNVELTVLPGETVIFIKKMRPGIIQVKKNNKCGIIPEMCVSLPIWYSNITR